MRLITAMNAHHALLLGLRVIDNHGQKRESRAGDVLVVDGPVITVYEKPKERVIFWHQRDANPFFHFMESLWMMGGRNDVAWLSQFSGNIAQFSDDGKIFHGAYGYRWMNHFAELVSIQTEDNKPPDGEEMYVSFNQLEAIVGMLKQNPDDRRAVLGIWSPEDDLGRQGKDVPCNLIVMFGRNRQGALDMTVCNRSNDIIWGAYGANVVHFSFLQEVMAAWIGCEVGKYWQVSNNWHAYVDTLEKCEGIVKQNFFDPYGSAVSPYPIVNGSIVEWFQDLSIFLDEGPIVGFRDVFFRRVATPMYQSWMAWKNKDDPDKIETALEITNQIAATDWRLAAREWLERRRK